DNVWTLVEDKVLSLKEKIEKIGKPLKDWNVKIYRGVLTGFNEAFIIDTKTRDKILANCKTEEERKRTEEIIKLVLRGRDIERWRYKWAGLWLIGTFPALNLNIDDYPALKEYLKSFGERLNQDGKPGHRKKTNNKWFETQDNISYYPEFEKEKIVWQEIVSEPSFAFDNTGIYCESTSLLMTGKHLKYLFVVLNSKSGTFFFKHFYSGGGLGEKGYRYKKVFLEKLPIP
ncbi:MAG: TaqI-like C-terminal specificity domain-containing protein, partial [Candidatus Kapaibacteriota bacterium]